MLRANRDWIETTTFARAVDSSLPLGKVFLPDGSYREMTEWALPPESLRGVSTRVPSVWPRCRTPARSSGSSGLAATGATSRRVIPKATRCTPGCWVFRGGWRRPRRNPDADPDYLEIARQELYRGQCNCPYWHGSFGGLYLPHLQERDLPQPDHRSQCARRRRGSHRATRSDRGRRFQPRRPPGSPPRKRPADRLGAAGAGGATSTSWTCGKTPPTCWRRSIAGPRPTTPTSLRPRPPATTARRARRVMDKRTHRLSGSPSNNQGLDHRLVYDRYPRKALVDHFYPDRCDPGRPDRLPRDRAR